MKAYLDSLRPKGYFTELIIDLCAGIPTVGVGVKDIVDTYYTTGLSGIMNIYPSDLSPVFCTLAGATLIVKGVIEFKRKDGINVILEEFGTYLKKDRSREE